MPFQDDNARLHSSEFPEEETIPCPSCKADIYEDSESCPHCGHYLTEETDTPDKPLWIVLTAVVCLLMALWWVFNG